MAINADNLPRGLSDIFFDLLISQGLLDPNTAYKLNDSVQRMGDDEIDSISYDLFLSLIQDPNCPDFETKLEHLKSTSPKYARIIENRNRRRVGNIEQ